MALNVKLAMLICLGFTGGMCWLVQNAARPIVELPSPVEPVAVAPLPQPAPPPEPRELARRFEQDSPVVVAAAQRERLLADAVAPPPRIELAQFPLHRPGSPASQRAAQQGGPSGQQGGGVVASAATPPPEPKRSTGRPVPLALVIPTAVVSGGGSHNASRAAGPAQAAEPATPAYRTIRVRKGDTLMKILRRELGRDDAATLAAVLKANPQLRGRVHRILVGETIRLPVAGSQATRGPVARSPRVAAGDGLLAAQWYVVRKHDSLAAIARRKLGDPDRWREIARLNGLRNADRIYPGMKLRLPARRSDT